MAPHPQKVLKAAGITVALAALALFTSAVIWPQRIRGVLHARSTAVLLGLWCGGCAVLIHPVSFARLVRGLRDFCKGVREGIEMYNREN